MWLGMWMTSCPEAMGWGFGVIFLKKAVRWDLNLDEVSWFLDLGEASPVTDSWMPACCWVWWNSQHSKNCVSLSLRVEKLKSQEGNKSFVPELPRVISVSSVSGFLCICTFHVSVYLYIRILVLFWICYNDREYFNDYFNRFSKSLKLHPILDNERKMKQNLTIQSKTELNS